MSTEFYNYQTKIIDRIYDKVYSSFYDGYELLEDSRNNDLAKKYLINSIIDECLQQLYDYSGNTITAKIEAWQMTKEILKRLEIIL